MYIVSLQKRRIGNFIKEEDSGSLFAPHCGAARQNHFHKPTAPPPLFLVLSQFDSYLLCANLPTIYGNIVSCDSPFLHTVGHTRRFIFCMYKQCSIFIYHKIPAKKQRQITHIDTNSHYGRFLLLVLVCFGRAAIVRLLKPINTQNQALNAPSPPFAASLLLSLMIYRENKRKISKKSAK